MKKSKNSLKHSKPNKDYVLKIWVSWFFLVIEIGSIIYFLFINLLLLIFIIFGLIIITISELRTEYTILKRCTNRDLSLEKKALQFENEIKIQNNILIENIKNIEKMVKEFEVDYFLLEKHALHKTTFESKKEMQHFQDYKLKLNSIKDILQNIEISYNENIRPKLKILWTTKPRRLMRKIRYLSKKVISLNTQFNKDLSELTNLIKIKKEE